jgi:hypothetical protein
MAENRVGDVSLGNPTITYVVMCLPAVCLALTQTEPPAEATGVQGVRNEHDGKCIIGSDPL